MQIGGLDRILAACFFATASGLNLRMNEESARTMPVGNA
jgi:hypothetical protein